MRLLALVFFPGPALVGFSLGWLVHHAREWTGPAVMAPVGLAVTGLTYGWGRRRLASADPGLRPVFLAVMIAAPIVGVIIFGMLAFRVIE